MAVAVGHTVSAVQRARQWPAVHQVETITVTIPPCKSFCGLTGTGEYIIKTMLARECALYG